MIEKSSVEEGVRFGRKILVGVKLDAPELLTWTLAKIAEPGDTVMAIYIVGNGTHFCVLFL